MQQKPLARAPRGIWSRLASEATRKALGKRPECRKSRRRRRREAVEARLLPPECSNSLSQGRREAFGGRLVPNVAFWSHEKKLLESAQNPAKASGEGVARQVKACYCPQNAAKASSKGAARHLKAGYCLTLLSEATRKALGKRPESCKSFQRGRREAGKGMLLPPECSKSLW